MTPRIVVVGLGPGGDDHVTSQTLALLERIPHRYLRTAVHPTAHVVPDAVSFDDVYAGADTFDDVYAEIVDRLVTAAHHHGEIVYAVPGSPLVLERTVAVLRSRDDVETELTPAMSFLDVAWARLAIDPVEAAVTLLDGHEFATAAAGVSGAVLVAHTHANWVLSDVKLAIDDADELPAVLLQALGTPHERVVRTTWSEIDRTLDADHLTSLFVPDLRGGPAAGYVRFHELVRTLRERCPWDVEQTHRSLVPYLIEETYEVVDAIESLSDAAPASDDALVEELGDLLYQIEFHATIAAQEGRFTIDDVTAGIHDKLVRRHPHVFGDASAADAEAVLANWEAIKRAEKSRTSAFDGIASSLPALSYAHQIQRKAAKVGFDWPDVEGALPKVAEEAEEVADAHRSGDAAATADEVGDLLFAVVNVARHLGVEPESALRAAANKFRRRFERVERLAAGRGIDVSTAPLADLDALWDEAKHVRT